MYRDRTVAGHGDRSKFFSENSSNTRVQLQIKRSNALVHPVDVRTAPVRQVRFRVVLKCVGKIFSEFIANDNARGAKVQNR